MLGRLCCWGAGSAYALLLLLLLLRQVELGRCISHRLCELLSLSGLGGLQVESQSCSNVGSTLLMSAWMNAFFVPGRVSEGFSILPFRAAKTACLG